MTIWEFRQWLEQQIPQWVVLLPFVGLASLALWKLARKK